MKDYVRRAGKFILYMVIIFIIVLVIVPLLSNGRLPTVSFNELMHNQKFVLLFGLLFVYALAYPQIAFVKIKRHLNGTYADNRHIVEKAFEALQYIKTEDSPDKIVYRRKSRFSRFLQWYEDGIVIEPAQNPVIISGLRKTVTRIDRMIDQFLIRDSE